MQKIEKYGKGRFEGSSPKSIKDKVKITYVSPGQNQYMLHHHYRPPQHHTPKNQSNRSYELPGNGQEGNRSYELVVEYKQKFVRAKPETDRIWKKWLCSVSVWSLETIINQRILLTMTAPGRLNSNSWPWLASAVASREGSSCGMGESSEW